MKKIKVFDCGPCVANTKVELYEFDDRDPKSLKKAITQKKEGGGGVCKKRGV